MKSQGTTGAHGNMFLKVAMAKYKASQGVIVPVNVRAVCPFSKATRDASDTSDNIRNDFTTDRIDDISSEVTYDIKKEDVIVDTSSSVSTLTSNDDIAMSSPCSHAQMAINKVADEEVKVSSSTKISTCPAHI
jgi:hypothetical protein